MFKSVAVAAERDTFLDLCFYPAPGIAMIHHGGDIIVLVTYVVELKDTMIIQPTLLALQSLFVFQKLLSILVDTFFSINPSHV